MLRHAAVFMAALFVLEAAPTRADLALPPIPGRMLTKAPGADGTVGVYTPAGGGGILSNYGLQAAVGQTVQITFAFHWPYDLYTVFYGLEFRHRIQYDSSEVQIIGFNAVAPFGVPGNYDPNTIVSQLPNPSSGTITFGLFQEKVTTPFPSPLIVDFSGVFPFARVTLLIKSVNNDGLLDILVSSALTTGGGGPALLSGLVISVAPVCTTTPSGSVICSSGVLPYITGGGAMRPAYGVDIVPEPSAVFLFVGFVAIYGGYRCRRRRINF